MNCWHLFVLSFYFSGVLINAAILIDDDIDKQGLYSKSDHVVILTNKNFDKKIYRQKNAFLVQFYNSYCGHCRAFAPKYKNFASEIVPWKSIIKLAVLDCSVEENNEICRQFEVMAYPSVRYFHENYYKGNANVGDKFLTDTADTLKAHLIKKMQSEQSLGRLSLAPSLNIASYADFDTAVSSLSRHVKHIFLVFENENSTIGSELALDTNDYKHVIVKRVYDTSELAENAGVTHYPGLIAVESNLDSSLLTPQIPSKQNLLKAINSYLSSKHYIFPVREIDDIHDFHFVKHEKHEYIDSDIVYYSDLEKTLKTSFHTEITRHKDLNGEALLALMDYLEVLLVAYPFRGKLREFVIDLRRNLSTKDQWAGSEVYDLVRRLEELHAPIFTSNLEYIRCKGSQPKYRGYTCGLWTLFHTLTVNTVQKPGNEGPKVLQAMHGYIKHFFGCTECAEHFQAMATRNRISDVLDNSKAILWLWVSHNEVNLRLAGDVTEDPYHPKIQFPSVAQCSDCRHARGGWYLPAVYEYLLKVYDPNNILDAPRVTSTAASSPFSNLDIGLLSLLYIFYFIMLILVVKFFISRHLLRKRKYKHAWGKV